MNAKVVRWTPLANDSLEKIIKYLEENWTEKEIKNFLFLVNSTVLRLSKHPETSIAISGKIFRRAIVDKNNSLIFKITADSIIILYVFDNRQNPNKLKQITRTNKIS